MSKPTIKDVRNYLEGHAYYAIAKLLPRHIREQAEERAELCAPCLDNGRCLHCTCKTPHVFYAPHKKDKLDKWGPMKNRKEWEAYKESLRNDQHNNSINNGDSSSTKHSDRDSQPET